MKFWFSGEIQGDVDDLYRAARKDVLLALQDAGAAERDFGPVEKWVLIGIVTPDDHPAYPEVQKYDRRDKCMEFRLKIEHARFKSTDDAGRRKLFVDCLLRSTRDAVCVVPKGAPLDEIRMFIIGVARERGWLSDENVNGVTSLAN
jgi:hypothetical protein